MSLAGRLLGTALASALATWCLVWLARRAGWTDRAEGAEAARKLQGRAVPAVGGAALLVAGALATALDPGLRTALEDLALVTDGRAVGLALLLAFALGTLDDLGLLVRGPWRKLAGQALAATPLAAAAASEVHAGGLAALGAGLACLAGAVLAMNLANTFDNADGALAALGVLALSAAAPHFGAALVGFLPFNLDAGNLDARAAPPAVGGREPAADARRAAAPSAYLGDAGSHLVGMALFVLPVAWPIFWVPLLDLARVSAERCAAGSRPWIGDRRHLAHRLERRGLGRVAVVLCLLGCAAPAFVGARLHGLTGPGGLFGLCASALVYALLLFVTRGSADEPLAA